MTIPAKHPPCIICGKRASGSMVAVRDGRGKLVGEIHGYHQARHVARHGIGLRVVGCWPL